MGNKISHKSRLAPFRSMVAFMLASLMLTSLGFARADGIVPGHVLARLNAGTNVKAVEKKFNTSIEDGVGNLGLYSLKTPRGSTETLFAAQLSSDSRVAWAETDTYLWCPEVTAEPFHFAFDAGPAPGDYVNQMAYQQVRLGTTWQWSTGAGAVVAVLDTGATFSHPALQGHYLPGYNVMQPDQPPNDIPDGLFNAAVGHGTMIAGIIVRLAPGAKILPIRVLNGDGIGTMLDVVKGIDYAISSGAKVLNMSFGTTRPQRALHAVLKEAIAAGALIVASAGNDDDSQLHYPAANGNVVAVTSVEANNKKSTYSNFGDFITVVAPGSGIRSTYYTGGYANWSGTSFAAPFITAEAALLLSRHPTLTHSQIKMLIGQTAHSVDRANPEYEEELGNGIIDIETAVKYAPNADQQRDD